MCPSIGVPIGMFIGSVCFTLLVSEQFSVKYLGAITGAGGVITMKSTDMKIKFNTHILNIILHDIRLIFV